MWNKWLFKDLQELHLFQKPHQKKKNGQAAEQENGTNDMNSDSSASKMDEDSGETYDSTSLSKSKNNGLTNSKRVG